MPRKDYVPEEVPKGMTRRQKEQQRLAGLAGAAGRKGGEIRAARAEADRSPGWEERAARRERKRNWRAKQKEQEGG